MSVYSHGAEQNKNGKIRDMEKVYLKKIDGSNTKEKAGDHGRQSKSRSKKRPPPEFREFQDRF